MKPLGLLALSVIAGVAAVAAQPPAPPLFTWSTVVNNTDLMPGTPAPGRAFNSYNQPSVNVNGVVVIRARSRGGLLLEQPNHGIYIRDMGVAGSAILRILDRTTEVPQPNNAHYPPDDPLWTTFVETPSFPRIDMGSDTIATRGNHQPVWVYALPDGSETRVGTTGIYTNPFGPLITGTPRVPYVARRSASSGVRLVITNPPMPTAAGSSRLTSTRTGLPAATVGRVVRLSPQSASTLAVTAVAQSALQVASVFCSQ